MKNMELKRPIDEASYASLTSGDPKFKNARYNEMAARFITSLSIDVFLITGIVGYLTILKNGWGGAEASDILRHANIFGIMAASGIHMLISAVNLKRRRGQLNRLKSE